MDTDRAPWQKAIDELAPNLPPHLRERVADVAARAYGAGHSDGFDEARQAGDQMVEGIAQHFGPWAPLVRMAADHVQPANTADACQDGCRGRWPASGPHGEPGPSS
jgi:hypothetical protein